MKSVHNFDELCFFVAEGSDEYVYDDCSVFADLVRMTMFQLLVTLLLVILVQ